jgi:hypothetical protein
LPIFTIEKHVYYFLIIFGSRSTNFSPGSWLIGALIASCDGTNKRADLTLLPKAIVSMAAKSRKPDRANSEPL